MALHTPAEPCWRELPQPRAARIPPQIASGAALSQRGCTLGTSHLLPGTQFNCERASTGVHLEGSGLAAGGGPAAVLAVNEELPDLLCHCDVVHHHGQFGIVHGALLCQEGKKKRESAATEMLQEHFQEPLHGDFLLLPSLAKMANSQTGTSHEYSQICKPPSLVCLGAWWEVTVYMNP